MPEIKKMRGFSSAFRIRVDDYRLGLYIEGEMAEFIRVLPRRVYTARFQDIVTPKLSLPRAAVAQCPPLATACG